MQAGERVNDRQHVVTKAINAVFRGGGRTRQDHAIERFPKDKRKALLVAARPPEAD